MKILTPALNRLIELWLDEDLGRGDISNISEMSGFCSAYWIAKEEGVFCGGYLAKYIFQKLDKSVQTNLLVDDGESFKPNQRLLEIKGPPAILLAGERTALNLSMHLSGIATATASLVSQLEGTNTCLADTRKTTPGLRVLEKYATRCGGGINHRLGLDDAAMIKENHLTVSGNIKNAINKIKSHSPWTARVVVEAETPEEAEEAVRAGADGILLDEIPPEILHNLIPRLRELATENNHQKSSKQIILEASGVDPMNLRKYAETGIDLISCSAPITRSPWIDFSMYLENENQPGTTNPKMSKPVGLNSGK